MVSAVTSGLLSVPLESPDEHFLGVVIFLPVASAAGQRTARFCGAGEFKRNDQADTASAGR